MVGQREGAGVSLGITERKRVAEALQIRQERFDLAQEVGGIALRPEILIV